MGLRSMQNRKGQRINLALVLFLLPLLSSCRAERITAHMEYLSQRSLASYHVETPDPCLNNPPMGQRILISWSIPIEEFQSGYFIKLTIRFCNRMESTQCLRVHKNRGMYIYKLLNQDYFACGGVRTYKVELYRGNDLIECWKHQLWAELIVLNSE